MFNTIVSFACICYVSVRIWRIKYYYNNNYYYYMKPSWGYHDPCGKCKYTSQG